MSKDIVLEGWLTKSPPNKRVWRAKWRRRWFALRQSSELPGQYFLDYYADSGCRRRKGTIDLDLCEQVDAGLHMNKGGASCPQRLRGCVFTVRTSLRTYHLEADCEADMEKWVDAICRVCGLRSTEETDKNIVSGRVTYNANPESPNDEERSPDSAGPYIPISECITGARDPQRAFSFETEDIGGRMLERQQQSQLYTSQPQIRVNNAEFSENESNPSDDECKSLNNSQPNIGDWSVSKTFMKLNIQANKSNVRCSEVGPPVPPRPPKTFTMVREYQREPYYGPKMQEPPDVHLTRVHDSRPSRRSHTPAKSYPVKMYSPPKNYPPQHFNIRSTDDDDEIHHPMATPYCNLLFYPPAVDRALKPRPASQSQVPMAPNPIKEIRADTLQYLDLDLHISTPSSDRPIIHDRRRDVAHVDTETIYKTVDFLKTEAFNITRQDAAASRKTAI